jgi:hypothetical protein
MRRLLTIVITTSLLVAGGCGTRYTYRMEETLKEMKYNRELDKNLEPAPADGQLKEMNIYVRPPKKMELAKTFGLGAAEPGKFDIEKTYYEGSKSFLHVLARQKTQKKAPAKGAPPSEPAAARGPFNADVVAHLKSVFGEDDAIALEKFKEDAHKKNSFKRAIFTETVNNVPKTVQAYLIKDDKDEVALIFVFDDAEKTAMNAKIKYCLESFALGNKARNKYNGATTDEAAEAAPVEVKF